MSTGIVPNNPIRADNFRGFIFPYVGSTAPDGFLMCDGSEVSRATYAGLYALVGDTYGAGDGSTTFNLPDFKDRFPLGYADTAPSKVFTFASRSGNNITVTSDVLSNSQHNEIQTGQKVRYSAPSGAISGLTHNTDYYLVRVAYNQFALADSMEQANQGIVKTLSSNGTGTQTFTLDFTARPMGSKGGTELLGTSPKHAHYPSRSTGVGGSVRASSVDVDDDNSLITDTSSFGSIVSTGELSANNMPPFTVVNFVIKY